MNAAGFFVINYAIDEIINPEKGFSGSGTPTDQRDPVFRNTAVGDLVKARDAGGALEQLIPIEVR